MNHSFLSPKMESINQTIEFNNLTYIKDCIEYYGNEEISFQLSNFLFFIAFLIPHNASNQICDLLFRLLITMGCSVHVIWIISIKDHCFFNYIILFWPIFLLINFLHSFHLFYKLSPASLPREFIKLYDTLFEPIKLTKNEFKILIQHSLIINLNEGENYLIENKSLINEKVGILLEGKLDVKQNDNAVFLHQIFPNDFIDSVEFKYMQFYDREEKKQSSNQTCPLTTFNSATATLDSQSSRTDSILSQVLIDMETGTFNKQKANQHSCDNKKDNRKPKEIKKKKLHPKNKQNQKKIDLVEKKIENRSNKSRTVKDKIILSIDSPMKGKQNLDFDSMNKYSNKLAQVTITASENCKLICWKRDLLVNDTLANNKRLCTVFNNLIGQDIINKLYLVNESQRLKQQQIISEIQSDQQDQQINQTLNLSSKLLAHNPLKGDNLLSNLYSREINLFNAYPYIPNENMMFLNPYYPFNMNNLPRSAVQIPPLIMNPYLNYFTPNHLINDQAISNSIVNSSNVQNIQEKFKNSSDQ